MQAWLAIVLAQPVIQFTLLAADASVRCYYRVTTKDGTNYIVMDAPPHQHDMSPFIHKNSIFKDHCINVPTIYAHNFEHGFMLLEDLGDRLYINEITPHNATFYYQQAFLQLIKIQSISLDSTTLPHYTKAHMQTELHWFKEWYVEGFLNHKLSSKDDALLTHSFDLIINNIVSQPTACIHYDFQSRNLLMLPNQQTAVIDFQDARWGPIAFDLMSLIYDHYITWPYSKQKQWIYMYQQQLLSKKLITESDSTVFASWVDWLALLRILRNMGNFSRLSIRDHKSRYLNDLPRIYNYIIQICTRHNELSEFAHRFKQWRPSL